MKTKIEIVIFDLDDTLYDTSNRIDAVTPNFAEMRLGEGVRELLEKIKIRKILLTQGEEALQNKKIQALGIEDLFDEVIVVSNIEDKMKVFQEILHRGISVEKVLVVGDRRDGEIRFGNIVGFFTALVPGFKYKGLLPRDEFDVPDFDLSHIEDVYDLLG